MYNVSRCQNLTKTNIHKIQFNQTKSFDSKYKPVKTLLYNWNDFNHLITYVNVLQKTDIFTTKPFIVITHIHLPFYRHRTHFFFQQQQQTTDSTHKILPTFRQFWISFRQFRLSLWRDDACGTIIIKYFTLQLKIFVNTSYFGLFLLFNVQKNIQTNSTHVKNFFNTSLVVNVLIHT